MNGTPNRNSDQHVEVDGALDPRAAADMIERTERRARRQFEAASPLAALLGAGVFLFGYGSIWFSMRDQHVYTGPAGWAVALLYGLIVVAAIVGARISQQAQAGIGGRSRRQAWGRPGSARGWWRERYSTST